MLSKQEPPTYVNEGESFFFSCCFPFRGRRTVTYHEQRRGSAWQAYTARGDTMVHRALSRVRLPRRASLGDQSCRGDLFRAPEGSQELCNWGRKAKACSFSAIYPRKPPPSSRKTKLTYACAVNRIWTNRADTYPSLNVNGDKHPAQDDHQNQGLKPEKM